MLPASSDPVSHAVGLCPQACMLDLPWRDCPLVSIPGTLLSGQFCTPDAPALMVLIALALLCPPEAVSSTVPHPSWGIFWAVSSGLLSEKDKSK